MLATCPTKPPQKGNFLPRKAAKEFKKLNKTISDLKQLRQSLGPASEDEKAALARLQTHLQENPSQIREVEQLISEVPQDPTQLA